VNFVVRVLVNMLALGFAAWLFDGIDVEGAQASDRALTLLLVALVFGLVNAIVAPIVKLLSLPFIILTLGLLLLVINALMLMLTAWIAEKLDIGFTVDGFWTAVLASIVISIVSAGLSALLSDD
jgi:putative membrane protein